MSSIRPRTAVLAPLFALATLVAFAAPARATYHEIKITQVGNGDTAADYAELQMYAPGQNLVAGKMIRVYRGDGTVLSTFTFPANVPSGDNQRTIYVARDDGPAIGTPDFLATIVPDNDLAIPANGALCYGAGFAPGAAVDCVSWGAFPGVPGGDPSPMGAPAPEIGLGQALHRSIARGCRTELEASDDTDNSAADFALGPQTPRNNATAPSEAGCRPNTKIRKRPKNRSDDSSPTFKFKSTESGSKFKCKLDHKPFKRCRSPKTYHHLDAGRHVFKVMAIGPGGLGDKTPAKDVFRVFHEPSAALGRGRYRR